MPTLKTSSEDLHLNVKNILDNDDFFFHQLNGDDLKLLLENDPTMHFDGQIWSQIDGTSPKSKFKQFLEYYRNNKIEIDIDIFENILYDSAFKRGDSLNYIFLIELYDYFACKDIYVDIICKALFIAGIFPKKIYEVCKDNPIIHATKNVYLRMFSKVYRSLPPPKQSLFIKNNIFYVDKAKTQLNCNDLDGKYRTIRSDAKKK